VIVGSQLLRRLHKVTLEDLDALGDDAVEALDNAVRFIWLVREVRSSTPNSGVVLEESGDDLPSYLGVGENSLGESRNRGRPDFRVRACGGSGCSATSSTSISL
jgi:hypothetical protein